MKQQVLFHVPAHHPALAGHFPGMPIVPGVVLLDEAMYVILEAQNKPLQGWKIGSAKFLSPLGPGASVVIEYETQESGAIHFHILEGDRRIATGSLTPPA